ncbi:hypothetical protein [Candidatus Trichorickettsia mobilis]|uniref:hypothetical protein n=1 Tax=Candidatus Trichorickettsia mobilis TaxID=1346319 RepID=UPI0029313B40|nr:hypothetical protein [Candidatus Trichorickettsia mobilis]
MNKNIFITLLCCLTLVACSGRSHPKMISFTPASVVVDYSDNDLYEATGLAQQFCSSINKDAQYVRTNETGWVSKERHAFFNCIESANKNAHHNSNSNTTTPIINNFK